MANLQENLINLTDPTPVLAEAAAVFTKSVQFAFAEVQRQARDEVQNVCAEWRLERDDAIKAVSSSQLETQASKLELEACRASLRQAEMTIAHQNDTILQLKREITQWQDQSRNWQEHFLRVEQQRCSLASRLEEALSRQHSHLQPTILHASHSSEASTSRDRVPLLNKVSPESPTLAERLFPPSNDPLAHNRTPSINPPASKGIRTPQSVSKAVKPVKSMPKVMSTAQHSRLEQSSRQGRGASARKSAPKPAVPSAPPAEKGQGTQSTVIRRVSTVIRVPIKQEDSESEAIPVVELPSILANGSSSSSSSASTANRSVQKRTFSTKVYDDDGRSFNHPDVWVPRHESEEDDELMMGTEASLDDDVFDEDDIASLFSGSSSRTPPVTRNRSTLNSRKRKPGVMPKRKQPAKARRL